MEKKIFNVYLGSLLYILSASVVHATVIIDGGSEACTNLIAASTDVGDVCLSTDGTDNFFVEYTTAGVWVLNEVASWLDDELDSLPTDKNGDPTPGQFPYFQDLTNGAGAVSHTFTIPFMDVDLDPDALVGDVIWYLAAHAVVTDSSTLETAWADGPIEVGSTTVFTATVSSAVPEPSILALLSLGIAGLGFTRSRMKA